LHKLAGGLDRRLVGRVFTCDIANAKSVWILATEVGISRISWLQRAKAGAVAVFWWF
jgi:hypothetical protein